MNKEEISKKLLEITKEEVEKRIREILDENPEVVELALVFVIEISKIMKMIKMNNPGRDKECHSI